MFTFENYVVKEKFLLAYMDVAKRFSKLSSAERLQVGAIAVKNDRIISIGFNGTPAGWDNCCEYEVIEDGWPGLKTKPEVLHAESNCISKLARSSESGEGAAMFVTHAPCIECAKLIYQSGIATVYYHKEYGSVDGIEFLEKCGITVNRI